MNIQVEHNKEEHTARLVVPIDVERFEKAKKKAARNIAMRVNIPGFRKGKAPYRILVQNGLESQIIMDAVDELGQEIYKEALEASELSPYGPGSFDDFELDPTPVFIYSLPLEPTVELNDYRSVRLDYTEPEVSDETVNDMLERFRQDYAVVEESQHPIAEGNRITVDIHSEFADDPPENAALSSQDPDDDDDYFPPAKGENYFHEHDAVLMLEREDEPILPGFIDAMIGANVDDDVEFELTIPDDTEEYDELIAGRKIQFNVTVNAVEDITLPPLNDDLAARITEDEETPLTLLELRMRIRENMQTDLSQRAKQSYAENVLEEMVKIADIAYPEDMVEEQIETMVEDLKDRLSQQSLDLDTYIRLTNTTLEELQEKYREPAINAIKRALVLREFIEVEKIELKPGSIEARIEETLQQFGEQAEAFRSMFDTPNMRVAMINDMIQEEVYNRMTLIGQGRGDEIITAADEPAEVPTSEEPVSEAPTAEAPDTEATETTIGVEAEQESSQAGEDSTENDEQPEDSVEAPDTSDSADANSNSDPQDADENANKADQ